ncbi:hypothetical protein OF83DRAFT_1085152 [Amylostereum chailletii]|nr:hypothetical protein OF83DRAFT_1085152 [Amylostereum chailletii]
MDVVPKSRASSFDSSAYAQPVDPDLAFRREQARLRAISPRGGGGGGGTGRASLPPSFSYQDHSLDSADSYIMSHAGRSPLQNVSTWASSRPQPAHLPNNYRQSTFFVQTPYACPSPDIGPASLPPSPIASSPLMSPASLPETMDIDDGVSDVSGPSSSPSPSPAPQDEQARTPRYGTLSHSRKVIPSRFGDASYDPQAPYEDGHVSDSWRSHLYTYPPPAAPRPLQDHPYKRVSASSSSRRSSQAVPVVVHPSAPGRKAPPKGPVDAPTDIYPFTQHQFQISQFKVPGYARADGQRSLSRSQSVGSVSFTQPFDARSSASTSALPPPHSGRESGMSFPASPTTSSSSRSSTDSPPPSRAGTGATNAKRGRPTMVEIPVEPESVTRRRRGPAKSGKLSKADPDSEDYVFRHLCRPLVEFNPPHVKCHWAGGCGKMLSTKHQDEVHDHLQDVHGVQLKGLTGEGRTRKVACEWAHGHCSAKVMQLANVFGHIKRHEGVIEFECILCHTQIDRREKMRSHCKNGECPKITGDEAESIHLFVARHGIQLDRDHRSNKLKD